MRMDSILDSVITFISNPVTLEYLRDILLVCVGCFLLAGLFRLISGKNGSAVKSVSAVLGILILYCMRVVLEQWDTPLQTYFVQLPFVQINFSSVEILSLDAVNQPIIYIEIVNLLMLVFVFNLLETLLPIGKNFFVWLLLRCVSVIGTFVIYTAAQFLFVQFLPSFITDYAPLILLVILGLFLAVTVFKWLFGLILGITASPIVGGIYTFFISNIVGKQLSKSALTTAGLFLLVYLCKHYSITIISIPDPVGIALALVTALTIGVWFVISRVF